MSLRFCFMVATLSPQASHRLSEFHCITFASKMRWCLVKHVMASLGEGFVPVVDFLWHFAHVHIISHITHILLNITQSWCHAESAMEFVSFTVRQTWLYRLPAV